MKKISFLFLTGLCFVLITKASASNVKEWKKTANKTDTLPLTDPVYQYLKYVNLTPFLNKPIDSLLAMINRNIDKIHVSSCASTKEGLYRACYLQVEYGTSFVKDFTIRFYVKDYFFMNRYDANRIWDPFLMRKEKPCRIEINYLWDKINSSSQ